MSLLLDVSTRALEEVIYYDAYIVTQISGDIKKLKVGQILREAEYQEASEVDYAAAVAKDMVGGFLSAPWMKWAVGFLFIVVIGLILLFSLN